MFDAITSHNNIIFLYPNALYAEIELKTVVESSSFLTVINQDANGFNYEIEEKFHKYEYDNTCLELGIYRI